MATLDDVRRIIARITRTSDDDINAETELKDIKADSLHWVQIIVGVENAYDIEIDFEEMKNFSTINDFLAYIDGLKK